MAHVPAMSQIGRARLIFGGLDTSDREHAENMLHLDNFSIAPVAHSTHNVVMSVVAEGRLFAVFSDFLGREARPNAIQVIRTD